MDNNDSEGLQNARSLKNFLKGLKIALIAVAVVALCVVVIPAIPAAITVAGPVVTVALTTPLAVTAGLVAVGATAGAIVTHIIEQGIDDGGNDNGNGSGDEEPYIRPQVYIRLNGEIEPTDKKPSHKINHGNYMIFDISIVPNSAVSQNNVVYSGLDFLYAYDPEYNTRIDIILTPTKDTVLPDAWYFSNPDAWYFDILYENLQLTIARNNRTGHDGDIGDVQFIIPFKESVSYNGSEINEFIFNFTVLEE